MNSISKELMLVGNLNHDINVATVIVNGVVCRFMNNIGIEALDSEQDVSSNFVQVFPTKQIIWDLCTILKTINPINNPLKFTH